MSASDIPPRLYVVEVRWRRSYGRYGPWHPREQEPRWSWAKDRARVLKERFAPGMVQVRVAVYERKGLKELP